MDVIHNTGIKNNVIEQICKLAEKYELEQVILFGSRARGDFRHTSDIDIAVKGGDTVNFTLSADEETDTLLMYDVVDLDGPVQPQLLETIHREGKTIYEKI